MFEEIGYNLGHAQFCLLCVCVRDSHIYRSM